jgi:hypothetical protein
VTSIYLYREGIAKSWQVKTGLRTFYRSLRASWAPVQAHVDGSDRECGLKTACPCRLDVAPGHHRLVLSGSSFEGTALELELVDGEVAIVSIEPRYLEGVSDRAPFGSLVARRVNRPQDLGLYRFYAGLPTSLEGKSVTHSVIVSMALSLTFVLVGVAAILVVPWAGVARGPGVGAILLLPCLFIASAFIPMGLGGVAAGSRFLRMPRDWRSP